jgi:hypothetical protein
MLRVITIALSLMAASSTSAMEPFLGFSDAQLKGNTGYSAMYQACQNVAWPRSGHVQPRGLAPQFGAGRHSHAIRRDRLGEPSVGW